MPHELSRKISQSLTLIGALAFALATCSSTNAQTKQVIYRFKGNTGNTYDGFEPGSPHLSGHLLYVDYCPVFEGAFLWIGAIGALASLGGVDPLGDLLLAISAVGEAVTYVSC